MFAPDFLLHSLGLAVYVLVFTGVVHLTFSGVGLGPRTGDET